MGFGDGILKLRSQILTLNCFSYSRFQLFYFCTCYVTHHIGGSETPPPLPPRRFLWGFSEIFEKNCGLTPPMANPDRCHLHCELSSANGRRKGYSKMREIPGGFWQSSVCKKNYLKYQLESDTTLFNIPRTKFLE